jgi:hypothetical protein
MWEPRHLTTLWTFMSCYGDRLTLFLPLLSFSCIKIFTVIWGKSFVIHGGYLYLTSVGSWTQDRLCGLVVRVPGYRSTYPGVDFRRYQIFWDIVGLERGPLSLVIIPKELVEWKSSSSRSRKSRSTAMGIHCTEHVTPSIRKSWH